MKQESGNILIIILIAIFLLGSLTAMLSRSGDSNNETGDFEQNSIAASSILKYASGIEAAVTQLRQRGCSENQISFQHDEDNDGDYNDNDESYYNLNAPLDLSCHVFAPEGAGMEFINIDTKLLDEAQSAEHAYGEPYFNGNSCVARIGTDNGNYSNHALFCDAPNNGSELLLIIPYLKQDICAAINRTLYGDSTIPRDLNHPANINNGARFKGNYNADGREIGSASGEMDYKKSFCHDSGNNPGVYDFYHVLIVR